MTLPDRAATLARITEKLRAERDAPAETAAAAPELISETLRANDELRIADIDAHLEFLDNHIGLELAEMEIMLRLREGMLRKRGSTA